MISSQTHALLYGYASREEFKKGFEPVFTYTKKGESGASLRTAGFIPVAVSQAGKWNRPGRRRRPGRNIGPKIRWERRKGQILPLQRRLHFEKLDALS